MRLTLSCTIGLLLLSQYVKSQEFLFPPNEKDAGITISIPGLNKIMYHEYLTSKSESVAGFWGFSAGGYFRKHNVKYTLDATIMATLVAPMGPICYWNEGIRENISTRGVDAMVHYPVHQYIHLVGGVNFMSLKYNRISFEDTIPSLIVKDQSIGLTAGIEASLGWKETTVGIFYRPSLISIGHSFYRHVISFDVRLDIPVWLRPKPVNLRKKRANKKFWGLG